MGRITAFDFDNRETFLCFRWARDGGEFDAKAAI
jgi:hypothetical protein